jgi:hypothetical protein
LRETGCRRRATQRLISHQNHRIEETRNAALVHSANRHSDPDGHRLRGFYLASSIPLTKQMMAADIDQGLPACNMIDVHGAQAAAIARENVRGTRRKGSAGAVVDQGARRHPAPADRQGSTAPRTGQSVTSDFKGKISKRKTTMDSSLMHGLSGSFKKWSDADRPYDDDDEGKGVPHVPIFDPPVDDPAGIPEHPHQPWLVPGTGSSF